MLGTGYISSDAIFSISAFMNSTFALEDLVYGDRYDDNDTKRLNGYYIETDSGYQWSPPAMDPLMKSNDLNLTFAAIARSLTNALRTGSDTPPVSGKSGYIQIVLQVQWPWMVLPLTVVAGGLLQLQVSVTVSKETAMPVWKSSFLAVMSRGDEVAGLLHGCKTLEDFETKAKEQSVDLFESEHRALQAMSMSSLSSQRYSRLPVSVPHPSVSATGSRTALVSPVAADVEHQESTPLAHALSSDNIQSTTSRPGSAYEHKGVAARACTRAASPRYLAPCNHDSVLHIRCSISGPWPAYGDQVLEACAQLLTGLRIRRVAL